MPVPDAVRSAFDAELRHPLEDTRQLRTDVAAWSAAHRDGDAVDGDRVQAVAETLDALLKRVSRKTTPLHHRLIHATARWCIRPTPALDASRLRLDVEVVNETVRVVRRPELLLA